MIVTTNVFHADTKERICVPSVFKFYRMTVVNKGSDEVYIRFKKDEKEEHITIKPKESKEINEYIPYFFAKAKSGKQRLEILCIG